jgi:predicted transcriptional regulator
VVDLLLENPYVTTKRVAEALAMTNAGANGLVRRLEDRGWLQQVRVSGRGGRITWVASEVMRILSPSG